MRRLHPATIIVALLPRIREAIRAALPVLIGSFFAGQKMNQDWIAIGLGGFIGIFAIGAYWTTRYDIVDGHVVHLSGWIFRKDRRIPLEQVQNVNLRQNMLERIFKVATVDVETAMGRGRDLKLSVLSWPDAEKFRDEILHAAHLDVAAAPPKLDEPSVQLSMHDLFFGAVTENHLPQVLVAMVTLGGPMIGAAVEFASKLQLAASIVVFCGALMALALGSWLWGVASYFLKFGGFEVHRGENLFRITYGLLNKVQMAIRPSRIEYLRITMTLPQRLMGRASFHVGTAATFGEAGVFAPVALFVQTQVAYRSAGEVIPGLDVSRLNWKPFDPLFYRSGVVRSMIWTGIIGVAAFLVGRFAGGGAGVAMWALFGLIAIVNLFRVAALFLARPENGFAITEDALVVRQGYLHQSIAAMPIQRMENIAVTQPSWWIHFGAVKLSVQAMKHKVHVGALPASAIDELMARWNAKIEAPILAPLEANLAEIPPTLDHLTLNETALP